MKVNHLAPLLITSGLLTACQPTVNSPTSPKIEANPAIVDSSKYVSSSYILAEPLPNKKLKISITASDQDLYITNCNAYIGINLFDKANPQNNWGEVTNSCRSQDLIIPKSTTLTFERQITDSHFPINMNGTYQVDTALHYNPNQKDNEISEELRLSNRFKLIP